MMKKNNNVERPGFAVKLKRFFKHYFGLLVLALAAAALMTLAILYAFS